MKLKPTRWGIQIIPDNYPFDDVFIEHVLGLRKAGDSVVLVRKVSEKADFGDTPIPPLYFLETDSPKDLRTKL